METPERIYKEREFASMDPMDSDKMDGLEKFTIRKVGNPIIENGEVNLETARLIHTLMHKKIGARLQSKVHEETRYSRPVFFSKLAPKIDQFGRVEMESVVGERYERVGRICDTLVDELFVSCSQDETMVIEVFDLFFARVCQLEYKPDDLMSTLLICVQERKMRKKPTIISNTPKPSTVASTKIEIFRSDVDEKYRGHEKISIRVVSIREMLRSYFEKYPAKYKNAIEKCTGERIGGGQSGAKIIEEKISRIGVWEFAVNVWMLVRDWDEDKALEGGIVEPLGPEDEWILCPRWRKDGEDGAKELAQIVAQHYSKSG